MNQTEENKQESNYGIPWGFLAGVVVGIATGLYINSKAGKEKRKQLNEKISSWEDDLEAKLKNSFEEIKNDVLLGAGKIKSKAEEKLEKEKESEPAKA